MYGHGNWIILTKNTEFYSGFLYIFAQDFLQHKNNDKLQRKT